MIEVLDGFPDSVVAFAAKGRVTRKDYDDVLIPKLREALKGDKKIRCYYELGQEFSGFEVGAAWEDFKIGMEYLTRWERVAVVTDIDWIRITMNAFSFVMPGKMRVFATREAGAARNWVSAS